MDGFIVDETTKIHICGRVPDCSGVSMESGSFRIKGYEGPIVECDKCGQDMQLRTGRFGKYFSCTNETCTNTRKLLSNGEVAPPRADPIAMPELECPGLGDYFVLRDGAAGLFLAASKYPRNRLTRAPSIAEIVNHANELDPKFQYLLTAPAKDPDDNDALVRFSRKEKRALRRLEEKRKGHWVACLLSGWHVGCPDGEEELSQTRYIYKSIDIEEYSNSQKVIFSASYFDSSLAEATGLSIPHHHAGLNYILRRTTPTLIPSISTSCSVRSITIDLCSELAGIKIISRSEVRLNCFTVTSSSTSHYRNLSVVNIFRTDGLQASHHA